MNRIVPVFAMVALATVVGCSSSVEPTVGTVLPPPDGSWYTYQFYDKTAGKETTFSETVTVHYYVGDSTEFTVGRHLEAGADSLERFKALTSGDFGVGPNCCCEQTLGLATHASYPEHLSTTPAKMSGYEYTMKIGMSTQYIGIETVHAMDKDFSCVRISSVTHLWADSNATFDPHLDQRIVKTYWYSPEVRYFIRETEVHLSHDSVITSSEHDLTAYQLK